MPTAAILSQGDEVVTGQIVDTNAAWLADRLTDLGFLVVEHLTVGDDLPALTRAFTGLRADLVLCTGGLGPTDDDLTAPAVAATFGRPQVFDPVAWAQIVALYRRFGREVPEVNRRQAMLPEGSTRLDNPVGTAPGFWVEVEGRRIACMPGVPHEMRRMFDDQVLPRLTTTFALRPGRLVTLRTTGVGESTLQERIGSFSEPGFVLGYRTTPGENLVKLRVAPEVDEATLQAVVARLTHAIGTPQFGVDAPGSPCGPLPVYVGDTLAAAGATLAVAESCTGGLITSLCTAQPGASAWLIEGIVAYANEAKTRHLGVPASLINTHGAVSEPVARAMAEGARQAAGSTYGLATTGIAGPGGGSDEKPVGTVHFALATPTGTFHRVARFGGDRERVQRLAAFAAFDLLRRHLQGLPLG